MLVTIHQLPSGAIVNKQEVSAAKYQQILVILEGAPVGSAYEVVVRDASGAVVNKQLVNTATYDKIYAVLVA